MELKLYLQILLKKWWIIFPAFLITVVATIIFTNRQLPVYQSTTTLVVAPSPDFGDIKSYASGLSILSTRQEIAATYAQVAASSSMKKEASETIRLPSEVRRYFVVSGKPRAGTNIVEITVNGPDPAAVQKLANAIGDSLIKYAIQLYEPYILTRLDMANLPYAPISPRPVLNIGLAIVLGLVLGIGLAFTSEYLETPINAIVNINLLDVETGVYNKDYFLKRLSEEMVRAKRNRYSLTLSLMRVNNLSLLKGANSEKVRAEVLRQVAVLATQYLREEDIIGRFEKDVFTFLLPDTSGENARAIMEYLQTRITWTPFEISGSVKLNLKGIIGIVSYNHNETNRDELIALANKALSMAEVTSEGVVYLSNE